MLKKPFQGQAWGQRFGYGTLAVRRFGVSHLEISDAKML
jgi:hypothetical protein